MAYSRPGVYISERLLPAPLAQGTSANAAGAVVAPFAQGPETITLVTSWYDFYSTFGGYNIDFPAAFQVSAFFSNGGKELYVKRLLNTNAAAATATIKDSAAATVATITAKNKGTDGNNLRVKVSAGSVASTYRLEVFKEAGVADTIVSNLVTAGDGDDILLESYDNLVFNPSNSSDFAPTVINLISPNITVTDGASNLDPVFGIYPLASGSNGTTVVATDYTNYQTTGVSVFSGFAALDRPLVIFLPSVHELASGVAGVYDAAASWAESNSSFVIVETAANKTVAEAITFAGSLTDSSAAACYYPHLYIADPLGRSATAIRKIGPSGSIAGLYLKTDTSRGVFKAPAGIGAGVLGAVAIEKTFSSSELDSMNSSTSPVNPIRQIPGAGLSVMGARTLLQDGTANKYVNMRRSLNYIRKELKNLTEFAIFENNDERLWTQIRSSINVFLGEYRNQGGLRGANNAQAFFVKCDAENNSAAQIANGEVHIQVGVALQYPAEFVVIDLSQKTIN